MSQVSATLVLLGFEFYCNLTLLGFAIVVLFSAIVHHSTIDIQLRIDHACLLLVSSAEVVDWILNILLCDRNGQQNRK